MPWRVVPRTGRGLIPPRRVSKRPTVPRKTVAQFVGEKGRNATEYHDNDFDWSTCVVDGENAVARQREEYRTVSTRRESLGIGYSATWEDFHHSHSTGRFFKEKRYLTIAFPRLLESYGTRGHVIGEIGCGCGSALIPILRDNPCATAIACDVSSTAIEFFSSVCADAGIESDRVRLSVHASGSTEESPFEAHSVDSMLIIFTLSAFHPREMQYVLREAYTALNQGGMVLFRDYGMYDMAQLRFHGSQLVDDEHLVYRRADGTLSNFFSIEFLEREFTKAGFSTVECRYVTTHVTNTKKRVTMKRVYVHGVFQKRP